MAKKKKTRRSRQTTRPTSPGVSLVREQKLAPSDPVSAPAPAPLTTTASSKVVSAAIASVETSQWAYVRTDTRRIGILVIVCVLMELGLLYLFQAGLGAKVYGLVKL